MGRLIDVADAKSCPSSLRLRVGDMLLFHASGGRVGSGGIEMLGPFLQAVVGTHGEIVAPMGAPNTVMFRAHRPGRAVIEVMTGSPWHASGTTSLSVIVES